MPVNAPVGNQDVNGNLLVNVAAGGTSGTQYADGDTNATPTGTVALGKNASNVLHALSLDASGYLNVTIASGGGSGGTSSSFGAAFPATGTAVGATDGTNMQALKVDGSNNLLVKVNTALPTGANTIGAVTQASGPWTINVTQVGGASLALGNTTMSASIPVTIASNQTAFPVTQSGTWNIGTVTTVTTVSTVTGGGVASGATDSGNPIKIGGKYNSSPITLTDGQRGDLQLDVNGYTKVNVANTVTVASHAVTVASGGIASGAVASGAFASGSIGSGAIASGAVASGAFASGALASGSVVDGAVVTLGAKADAKSTATDTTAITIMQVLKQISASVQAPPSQNVVAAGDVAHDAADSGNPVKIGGKARTTNPTAVSDADRVDATFDTAGRMVVVNNQCRELMAYQTTTITSSTASTTIVTAIASTFCDITGIQITNSSATATLFTIRDSSGGTIRWSNQIPATSGIVIPIITPWPQATVNTAWVGTCGSSVASIQVSVQYAKNK